jgi:cullin 3
LEASFQQIHSKNASSLSYEELYRGAYLLVLKKKGEQLYDKVVDFERKWLQDTVRGEVGALITPDLLAEQSLVSAERRLSGERFLKSIKQQWGDHEVGVGMISDVTMYLVCLTSAFTSI